jgi:hypothetical protein
MQQSTLDDVVVKQLSKRKRARRYVGCKEQRIRICTWKFLSNFLKFKNKMSYFVISVLHVMYCVITQCRESGIVCWDNALVGLEGE